MSTSIFERLEKLLAMAADTSSPHEAAIAERRAKLLMAKHGISNTDLMINQITESEVLIANKNKLKLSEHFAFLASVIAEVFECRLLKHSGMKGTGVMFYGRSPNTDLAFYSLSVLAKLLDKARAAFIKDIATRFSRLSNQQKSELANDFCLGWSVKVSKKAEALKPAYNAELDRALDLFLEHKHKGINLYEPKSSSKNQAALKAGYAMAEDVQLLQGVHSTERFRFPLSKGM